MTQETETEPAGYAIFDLKDPRSVVNMVPGVEREAILALGPEWRNLSERELYKKVDPDPRDARLRLAFWDEYSQAQDRGRKMFIANVVRNICPRDYWDDRVVVEPEKLAFIVLPPKDYVVAMRALLEQGLTKLEEVLALPLTMKTAKGVTVPNVRLITEMVKIIQMLDLRVKGAIIQKVRVDSRSVNLNLAGDAPGGQMTLEDLDNEIKKVSNRIHDALRVEQQVPEPLPQLVPAVDVEFSSVGDDNS